MHFIAVLLAVSVQAVQIEKQVKPGPAKAQALKPWIDYALKSATPKPFKGQAAKNLGYSTGAEMRYVVKGDKLPDGRDREFAAICVNHNSGLQPVGIVAFSAKWSENDKGEKSIESLDCNFALNGKILAAQFASGTRGKVALKQLDVSEEGVRSKCENELAHYLTGKPGAKIAKPEPSKLTFDQLVDKALKSGGSKKLGLKTLEKMGYDREREAKFLGYDHDSCLHMFAVILSDGAESGKLQNAKDVIVSRVCVDRSREQKRVDGINFRLGLDGEILSAMSAVGAVGAVEQKLLPIDSAATRSSYWALLKFFTDKSSVMKQLDK